MLRQPAIQEGEVGIDQAVHTLVGGDELGQEALRLELHRLPQPIVVLGVERRVRACRPKLVEAERLPGKVVDESLGLRVVQHPVDLTGQRRPIGQ